MRRVLLLAELNEIDLVADALKARLAEVAAGLRDSAALAEARRVAARSATELSRARSLQAEHELAQQLLAEKLAQAERRLYGGQVKNPRELEDAEQDAKQLRRQLAQADDVLLEALIVVESASTTHDAGQATLRRLEAERVMTHAALLAEQARSSTRLAAEQMRSAALRRGAPADLLALYDRLRVRRAGRAVVKLDDDTCSACQVAASPSRLVLAREGDELAYCENCGRLIWSEWGAHD